MIIQRTVDTYCGYYDFAVSGGAIGTIDLQVPVPINSELILFGVFVKTAPTSGGLATISFDANVVSVSPPVLSVGTLLVATPVATFTLNNTVMGIYPGNVANPVGSTLAFPFSIAMSIGVAPLLTGQLQFFLQAISFDF